MNIHEKSISFLKRKLCAGDITKEEWDIYAHENNLSSARVLMDKKNVENFEELKKKVKKERERLFIYNNYLYSDIKKLQKKLDKTISNKGLQSSSTRVISLKLDKMVNEYYETLEETQYPFDSEIYKNYMLSYAMLKEIFIMEGRFPTIKDWNQYAKKTGLLSSKSLEYISRLEWHLLEMKIIRENNMKEYRKT